MNHGRVAVATALLLVAATPGFAGPKDDALQAVAQCATISDEHARLACYDAAAPKVKDALAQPAAAPQQVAQSPQGQETPEQERSWFGLPRIFGGSGPPPQTTPQQFGSENVPAPAPVPGQPAPPTPPPPLDSISAAVTDFAFHLDGRFTVFLDNGQIWQQLPGDTDRAKFDKHGPNKVTISRGLFDSYNLVINDHNAVFKVHRLK